MTPSEKGATRITKTRLTMARERVVTIFSPIPFLTAELVELFPGIDPDFAALGVNHLESFGARETGVVTRDGDGNVGELHAPDHDRNGCQIHVGGSTNPPAI